MRPDDKLQQNHVICCSLHKISWLFCNWRLKVATLRLDLFNWEVPLILIVHCVVSSAVPPVNCLATSCRVVQWATHQGTAVHCTAVQCNVVKCYVMSAFQFSAVLYSAVHCNAVHCSTVQCSQSAVVAVHCRQCTDFDHDSIGFTVHQIERQYTTLYIC